jgi:hypothetical protein
LANDFGSNAHAVHVQLCHPRHLTVSIRNFVSGGNAIVLFVCAPGVQVPPLERRTDETDTPIALHA